MQRTRFALPFVFVAAMAIAPAAQASNSSGALFTTLSDGSEVNYNQFPDKPSVYISGGPGPGAPSTAAGLTDGTYVFQVTDPSGKTLLSTDPSGCRQLTVTNGVISGVVPFNNCQHTFINNTAPNGSGSGNNTVQLIPFNDTTNPGGVYKAWVTFESSYLANGCSLSSVDCASQFHGFTPSQSKTDNFKVKQVPIREIDTRFFQDVDHDGVFTDGVDNWIDGAQVTWTDTLGASNVKSSYLNLALDVHHEAHVEGVENGTHQITFASQSLCPNPGTVTVDGAVVGNGPMTVQIKVSASNKTLATQIWVACE